MRRSLVVAAVAVALLATGCDKLVTKPSLYGKVEVQVLSRAGTGIPGAALTLYTGERRMGYGSTDADGKYTFEDVPHSRYGVSAIPPAGYARLEDIVPGPPTDFVDQLFVEGGRVTPARLTFLTKAPGAVVATVKEPDGTPVAGVAVTLYSPTGKVQDGITDAAGKWTFPSVPFGNFGVLARRPAVYVDPGDGPLELVRDGLVVDGGTTVPANFTFERCFGSITASIRDEANAPVPGAIATLYTSTAFVRDGVTGATGTHLFANLQCGEFGVSVRTPAGWVAPFGRGVSFVDGLIVHRGGALTGTLRVLRGTCFATLRVRVTDNLGATVTGARITLYTSIGVAREATTAADGLVTMSQISCDHELGVFVTPPPGYTAVYGSGTSWFDGLRFADGSVHDRAFVLNRP